MGKSIISKLFSQYVVRLKYFHFYVLTVEISITITSKFQCSKEKRRWKIRREKARKKIDHFENGFSWCWCITDKMRVRGLVNSFDILIGRTTSLFMIWDAQREVLKYMFWYKKKMKEQKNRLLINARLKKFWLSEKKSLIYQC